MEWVYLGIAAAGFISSVWGGISGSDKAKKAAAEEAKLEGIVTASKIEDLHKDEEVMRGQTIAATAGANVKVGIGSPMEILAEQAREFQRERFTVQKAGATRAAAATSRGRMASSAARWQGISGGADAAGDVASSAFAVWQSYQK